MRLSRRPLSQGRRDRFRAPRKNCKHDSDLRSRLSESFIRVAPGHVRAEVVTLGRRARCSIAISGAPRCPRSARASTSASGRCDRFEMAQRGGRDAATARARECPLGASEKRARTGRFATSDGLAGTEIIHDVSTRAERARHAAARCGRDADTHGLATRSGSAAPASMARPGPGRGRAPGRRPSDATLSPISLGTRRRTPSHHLDDTAHRPRHFCTRINTPRTVFCYIG